MTDPFRQTRDAMIAHFKAHAAALFAASPARQSVMLAVAQYWNDSANDEVHGYVIASSRATPVWPHECDYDEGDESNGWTSRGRLPLLAGEECEWCHDHSIDMDFYGGYGDSMVGAFEMFCRESAHQGMEKSEAFVPFAVARRTGEHVDVEIVGHALRTPPATIGSARGGADWPDARARALFAEVCRHADDDGPRAVLSDYLLEAHPDDPRGEAIALALARELDADTRARRDELHAAHWDRWMFPLGDVIAPGGAHFERGFLARAEVYAATHADRDRVLGAAAWGTVHTIRFAHDSCDLIAPTMTSLRDVGPLRDSGVHAIARERGPWAIETLRIDAIDDSNLRPLVRATNLPRLTTLELSSVFVDDAPLLRQAAWWPQLQRLDFFARAYGSLADWRALRRTLDVPVLSIAINPYWTHSASSWQIAFHADDHVSVSGAEFGGDASLLRLAELLGELPPDTRIELVSSRTRVMTDADVTWLHAYTGRNAMLRG